MKVQVTYSNEDTSSIEVVRFPSHIDSLMYHKILHSIRKGDTSFKHLIIDWINGYVI